MKRLLAILVAVLLTAAPVCVSAYTSPFTLPDMTEEFAEPGQPANIVYKLREGGTFLYCNNPEALTVKDLDKVFMLEKDVHGDVYFTAEHYNGTGRNLLFGLQLRNHSGKDATVTVKNVGWQNGGDWSGQQEWTDFFGTTYEIQPKKNDFYFETKKAPNPFVETSYTIPSGEYFYVCGGSSLDAYNHINVGGTANRFLPMGQVLNGACYFTVDGPEKGVDVAFVCYRSDRMPVTSDEQQGYVTERDGTQYGLQYLGSAPYLCAECAVGWEVDDTVKDGRLQTTYDTLYHDDGNSTEPYRLYGGEKVKHNKIYGWKTHLNPNWDSTYVGTDMMPFHCVTDKGKTVDIDNYHSDGTGIGANIGNWMVVYEERLSFKNSGSKTRTFTVNITQNGFLAMNVRDAEGGLVKSYYHSNPGEVHTIEVAPGETGEIILEYTLLANGYGSLVHTVAVGTKEEPEMSEESTEASAEESKAESEPEETSETSVTKETSEESGFVVEDLNDDPLVNKITWIVVACVVLLGAVAAWIGFGSKRK